MKKIIIVLFTFASLVIFSQQKTEYSFKYVYFMFENKKNGQNQKVPAGHDAIVTYDNFYKNYTVVYTDKKDVRAISSFDFVMDGGNFTVVREEQSKEEYFAFNLEKRNVFILSLIRMHEDIKTVIWFTNIQMN